MSETIKPIRADLPQWVHDELAHLPGSKKMNVERLMTIFAKKQIKQREKDEAKLNK